MINTRISYVDDRMNFDLWSVDPTELRCAQLAQLSERGLLARIVI